MNKIISLLLISACILSCVGEDRSNEEASKSEYQSKSLGDTTNNGSKKRIIKEQSFNIYLEDFGQVLFSTAIDDWVNFSLIRDDSTIYEFPIIDKQNYFDPVVEAVSFYDADKDGRKDVILILKGYSSRGKEDSLYYFNNLFINSGYKTFEKAYEVNAIADRSSVKTVDRFKQVIDGYYTYQTVNIGPARRWKSLNQYFLDKESRKTNIHIYLDDTTYYHEGAIWIRGRNLIIEGGANTKLFSESEKENVMWIIGTVNARLKNLQMKHKAQGALEEFGNCSGRVLGFDGAYDIVVENCDLNGSGLAGLHDNFGNKNILIKDSNIHNCSVGAYTDMEGNVWQEPTEHEVFIFENTRMYNNGYDRVLEQDYHDDL